MPEISIVILAKNQERFIGENLKVIFNQEINYEFEVIVIDSGSTDKTIDIVKKYPINLIQITPEEFGHGKTRNYGAQIAKGKIVVFLNADAIPKDENWLKSLIDNFKNDEKVAGVYSRIYPQADCNPLRSWEILNENNYKKRQVKYIENLDGYFHMNPRNKRKLIAFQTISCAIRKDLLFKYPFKDIEFGEDLEWSKRIMEKGFKIVFEPGSIVLHSHNFYSSFIKTFKKYFDDARLNNELFNIWPWRSFAYLAGCIIYKVIRDISYILTLNKNLLYKIGWLFYSPVIRLAEFLGIIIGANSQHLPSRLQNQFSLVCEIRKRPISL